MDNGSLARGQNGRGVALTIHPHLAPRLKYDWSYTPAPPLDLYGLLQDEFTNILTLLKGKVDEKRKPSNKANLLLILVGYGIEKHFNTVSGKFCALKDEGYTLCFSYFLGNSLFMELPDSVRHT